MNIIDLTWSDLNGFHRAHVIDPETCDVVAVAKEGRKVIETHAAFVALDRERNAAQRVVASGEDNARQAALRAGADDKPIKPKALRKAVNDAKEHFAEIDLEWIATGAKLVNRRMKYIAVVEHHKPALTALAMQTLDSAILSLSSASTMTRRAEATMSGAINILGGLGTGDFTPRPIVAPRTEIGKAGVPGIYATEAIDQLAVAVNYAMQIAEVVKEAEKTAKAEAIVEPLGAEDLGDDDEGTEE